MLILFAMGGGGGTFVVRASEILRKLIFQRIIKIYHGFWIFFQKFCI